MSGSILPALTRLDSILVGSGQVSFRRCLDAFYILSNHGWKIKPVRIYVKLSFLRALGLRTTKIYEAVMEYHAGSFDNCFIEYG